MAKNNKEKPNQKGLIYDMTPEDVEQKIKQNISVKDYEKNALGEVFTPIILINELLNKLPEKIWSNHKLKWLEPSNGIGNFPMVLYHKLMKGLEKWEPNKNKRGQHIIQNMLYMVEMNINNVKTSQTIFGSDANICCADFLNDDKWTTQFGVNKFDIIFGNPPFQTPKKEKELQNGTTAGKGILWDKFITKGLDLLADNGFLAFINPSGWRKPESNLYKLMTQQNQLIYLHIYGEKQGQDLFNIPYFQRVDLYIIEKKPKYKMSVIVDEKGITNKIDLSKWEFLPNYYYNNIQKIITTVDNGINVIHDYSLYEIRKHWMSKNKNSEYKYPVVHTITLKGLGLVYSKFDSGHFGIPKVLLNLNRNQYPVNDYDGEYGMSELTFGIPISSKKQGNDIIKAINTDEFKEIIKATKWGAFQTNFKMFKYFKPNFYKHFLKDTYKTNKKKTTKKKNTKKKNSKKKTTKKKTNKKKTNKKKTNKKKTNKKKTNKKNK